MARRLCPLRHARPISRGGWPGHDGPSEPDYPDLEALLADIRPRSQALARHQHPFDVPHARRYSQLVFNLPAYTRLLMDDFMRDGGEIAHRDFASPRQFASLTERTLVNATGHGARALLGDESVIPVRGQTARLIRSARWTTASATGATTSRWCRGGMASFVQAQAPGAFGNADSTPDRLASDAAVLRLAGLFKG